MANRHTKPTEENSDIQKEIATRIATHARMQHKNFSIDELDINEDIEELYSNERKKSDQI